jgi:integrase
VAIWPRPEHLPRRRRPPSGCPPSRPTRARGLWVDPRAGRINLERYATTWLDSKVGISPRTREIYDLQLRLHILPAVSDDVPALGSVPIADITPELVRAWYVGLAAQRGASVAAKAYTRLRQVFGQAVDDDRIAKNPCRIKKGASERHPEQRFASLAELYELAGAVPERYRALVLTAGLGGLRQGELPALRRRDVDILRATVAVHRKRLRLASGLVIEDDPKSEARRRRVALPGPLVAELDRHLSAYVGPSAAAYVFTTETGIPLDANNFRARVWNPATRSVGLAGLRFHDYPDLRVMPTWPRCACSTGVTKRGLSA